MTLSFKATGLGLLAALGLAANATAAPQHHAPAPVHHTPAPVHHVAPVQHNYGHYGYGYPSHSYYHGYGYPYSRSGFGIGIGIGTYPYYYNYPSVYNYGTSYYTPTYPQTVVVPTYVEPAQNLVVPSLPDVPVLPANPEPIPAPASNAPAVLNITVPTADAEVLIDGTPTRQRGLTREFASPALERGRDYSYEITVRWVENGQPMERRRTVPVHSGDRAAVDLRTP